MPSRLIFSKDGKDLDIELRNGKVKLGGWSSYEVWLTEHGGEGMVEYKIADLYCGYVRNLAPGITYRIETT